MNEYYFNIARFGRFLFRTDWDDDAENVEELEKVLVEKFRSADGYSITKYNRSKSRNPVEIAS